jgi:hypothetical protein
MYVSGIFMFAVIAIEFLLATVHSLDVWADRVASLLVPGMAVVGFAGNNRIHDVDFWIWATLVNWLTYTVATLALLVMLRFRGFIYRK